jgi:hypothetical protein
MPERRSCQVCGRPLVALRDGTARRHGRYGDCQGSGYRLDLWPIGQQLRHYAGSVWEVVDRLPFLGASHHWMTEYVMVCLSDPYDSFGGDKAGRRDVFHGEYLHRHGWTPVAAALTDKERPGA